MKKLEIESTTSNYTQIEYDENYKTAACNDYQIVSVAKLLTLCTIHFQDGPIKDNKINGIFMEDLLNIVKDRLLNYQKTEFACDYNAKAIDGINLALNALRERTIDRENRGVLGTEQI